MSVCYWGIVGFGLKVQMEMFDWKKCLPLIKQRFKVNPKDIESITSQEEFFNFLDDADICFDGLLNEFVNKEKHINYIGGADSDKGDYILFFPGYPWEFDKEDMELTENAVREKIYNCLKPYLIDSISKEDILSQIDHISTYGCG